jgi:hypothetical protein
MRTVLIGFVVVLLVLSSVLAVRYNQEAGIAQEQLNSERYQRLVSEENVQKLMVQNNSLTRQLRQAEDKVGQIQDALERTKAINEDLKERLDRAAEIKANLDKKIEELQKLVLPM